LGFFKYWGFFVASASALMERLGFSPSIPVLQVVLPVGISFYTFQTMSYTIDVYCGRLAAERRLDVFALYVTFFPQLVAGPIERAERLLPQLRNLPRHFERAFLSEGLGLIALGLFRKLAIADAVAPYVDRVFAAPGEFSAAALTLAVVGFALQIYSDFAGYSDIARGSARLLGIDLAVNFRQPYLARSLTDFWRRWHVTLSEWLRDYLYIPLGGNRRGRRRTLINLALTMLLGGLWHGAAWTFVIWGGIHGAYLALERVLPARVRPERRAASWWILATVIPVLVAWVPFRAPSLAATVEFFRRLLTLSGGLSYGLADLTVVVFGLAAVFAIDLHQERWPELLPAARRRPLVRGFAYGCAALAAFALSGSATVPFIYFQF
jgi:alginate O-acetyltransferase complex protein AlgI